jgi:hypothetical protein
MSRKMFFCHVNIFLLLDELPQIIIPYLSKSESKQNQLIWEYQCCWYATQIQLHNMLHLALEPTDRYSFSSLNDCQFVSQ